MKKLNTQEKVKLFLTNPNEENFKMIMNDHLCINLVPLHYLKNAELLNLYKTIPHMYELSDHIVCPDKKILLHKHMSVLCESLDDFIRLYEELDGNHQDFKLHIENDIRSFIKTTNDWFNLYYIEKKPNIRSFIIQEIYNSFKTYNDCDSHFDAFYPLEDVSDDMRKSLIDKMYLLAKEVEDYVNIMTWIVCKRVHDSDHAQIMHNCYEKILSLSQLFSDWEIVYEKLSNYTQDFLCKKLFDKAIQEMSKSVM